MSVIREHKLLVALVIISLLVIIAGVLQIKKSNHKAEVDAQQQAQLYSLTKIAEQAQAQLRATAVDTDAPLQDVIPEDSLAKAKAMEGKAAEIGSDDWCELMMAKNADDWTEEERSQFAQHCI